MVDAVQTAPKPWLSAKDGLVEPMTGNEVQDIPLAHDPDVVATKAILAGVPLVLPAYARYPAVSAVEVAR